MTSGPAPRETRESPKDDSDIFTTFEGDNHVLLQLVAKGLLTYYASKFEDLDQPTWLATSPASPSRRS